MISQEYYIAHRAVCLEQLNDYHQKLFYDEEGTKYITDTKEFAKKIKLTIEYVSPIYWEKTESSILGEILKEEDQYICKIDNTLCNTKQKFTEAHEIAHYILHRKEIDKAIKDNKFFRENAYLLNDKISPRQEFETNQKALEIILPIKLISQYLIVNQLGRTHLTWKNITDIAKAFGVHEHDVMYRLFGRVLCM